MAVTSPLLAVRSVRARLLVGGAGLLLAAAVLWIFDPGAADERPVMFSAHTGAVNTDAGLAIKGYDPVAYFTDGTAAPGDPSISAELDGVTWRFKSEEHRLAFLAHPTRYEPEYGGFCAYGLAQGLKTDIDPAAFSIIGGRLYLNASVATRTVWRQNLLTSISEADRNWPEVKDQPTLIR
jgi:hypothetical protein